MPRIVVFDSGLGSLSVIKSIQELVPSEVIYFADQASYPYGTKNIRQLNKIIKSTISKLQIKFEPDLIVVGSNTPSLLLDIEKENKVIGIFPPLKEAVLKTKTGYIGILATRSVTKSRALDKYISKNVPSKIFVTKINATVLVDLVETGRFLSQKQLSRDIIKNIIGPHLKNKKIDVLTLSSTHLPFLVPILKELFPSVIFLDPADAIAKHISKILKHTKSKKNNLEIFTSGNVKIFQKQLVKIGIKNKVKPMI